MTQLENKLEQRCSDLSILQKRMKETKIKQYEIYWNDTKLALLRKSPQINNKKNSISLPPILLLHGSSCSTFSVFDLYVSGYSKDEFSMMSSLANYGLDVFSLDFAGYGLSDSPKNIDTLDTYVEQLSIAINWIYQSTGINPVVIGWSSGGQILGKYIEELGEEMLSGLVLWGVVWGGGPDGRPGFMDSMNVPKTHRRLNNPEYAGSNFETNNSYDPKVKDAFVKQTLFVDPTSPTSILHTMVDCVPIFSPQLITKPTLVIRGTEEPQSKFNDSDDCFLKLSSKFKFKRYIKGGDHNLQFNHCKTLFFKELFEFTSFICENYSQKASKIVT